MKTTAEFPGSILIIDDDPAILALLKKALTKAGHDVEVVGDGEAALAKLAKEHFDLLIGRLHAAGDLRPRRAADDRASHRR
jgi:DNA-binding response OmpR family regulator